MNWSNILTKDFLIKEYIKLKKSYMLIANELGCGESTVIRYAQRHGIKSRSYVKDLEKIRFGKLLVKKRTSSKLGKSCWLCECTCGNEIVVFSSSLIQGRTKSCGCLLHERPWKGFEEISGNYWGRCKRSAKSRGHLFDLQIEYAWDLYLLQNRKCALSGTPIVFNRSYCNPRSKELEFQTASMDRIDSNNGYVVGNVQWLHVRVNYMKQSMVQKEFIGFCRKISECCYKT